MNTNKCVEAFKRAKHQTSLRLFVRDDEGMAHAIPLRANSIGLRPMTAREEGDYWLARIAKIKQDMGGR